MQHGSPAAPIEIIKRQEMIIGHYNSMKRHNNNNNSDVHMCKASLGPLKGTVIIIMIIIIILVIIITIVLN